MPLGGYRGEEQSLQIRIYMMRVSSRDVVYNRGLSRRRATCCRHNSAVRY